MIPTAAEFYTDFVIKNKSDGKTLDLMIEFAKLHVQEALKEASVNAKRKKVYNGNSQRLIVKRVIDPDSILNAYPLTNIK